LVCLFGALDEGIEFDEGVRSEGRGEVLGGLVGGGEFFGEVREIGKGEFAGVGLFADAEKADRIVDYVASCLGDVNLWDKPQIACARHTVGCIVHSR
jgi:hypothetical protein